MEVKVTGHSHSARNTLHYIFYGSYDSGQRTYNEAKANANGIRKRNELVVGYNCHSGYKHSLKDFDDYLKQKPKNKVQTLNIVLSFARNDFNFRNPEDCYEASTIARHFMTKAFPNHQAIIALQQDNQRAIPHIHLIVCALSMQPPYKTIPGGHSKAWYQKHPDKPYQSVNYGIEHLRHIGKECLNEYEGAFNRSLTGLTQRGQSTTASLNRIQTFMRKAVSEALSEATNKQTFRKILSDRYSVNASFKHHKSRRRRKLGRRSRQSRYKRDGVVFRYDEVRRDKEGNIMYRKNGKPRVHRHYLKSSTLARFAPELSYKNIFKIFHKNHQRKATRISAINERNQSIQNDSYMNAPNRSMSINYQSSISTSASILEDDEHVPTDVELLYSQMDSDAKDYLSSRASQSLSVSANQSILSASTNSGPSYSSPYKANGERSMKANISNNASASISFDATITSNAIVSLNSHSVSVSTWASSLASSNFSLDSWYGSFYGHQAQLVKNSFLPCSNWIKLLNLKKEEAGNKCYEAKRVSNIMPKFSTDNVRRYAWWSYSHAIPAYLVGYDNGIPRFSIYQNKSDVSYLHKLLHPIIHDFKVGKAWTIKKWNAGKKSINKFMKRHHIRCHCTFKVKNPQYQDEFLDPYHEGVPDVSKYRSKQQTMNITDIAGTFKHSIINGYHHQASKFKRAWKRHIEPAFERSFIYSISAKSSTASLLSSSASSASSKASIKSENSLIPVMNEYYDRISLTDKNYFDLYNDYQSSADDWVYSFVSSHSSIMSDHASNSTISSANSTADHIYHSRENHQDISIANQINALYSRSENVKADSLTNHSRSNGGRDGW